MPNKTVEFFAQVRDGDIVAITQAIPPHELTENQIELTKEAYYIIRAVVHDVNGGVIKHLREVISSIEMAIANLELK